MIHRREDQGCCDMGGVDGIFLVVALVGTRVRGVETESVGGSLVAGAEKQKENNQTEDKPLNECEGGGGKESMDSFRSSTKCRP